MIEIKHTPYPPIGVITDLKLYFKEHHIKQKDIQQVLNYKSPQAVSNLFRTVDRYLNRHQAEALCRAYNFNFEFLTKGEGSLIQKVEIPKCIHVAGSFKDQFYTYVFDVFQKTAFALQNSGVRCVFGELNNLAMILNTLEENGELSEDQIQFAFKITDITIRGAISDIGFKEELKVLHNKADAK